MVTPISSPNDRARSSRVTITVSYTSGDSASVRSTSRSITWQISSRTRGGTPRRVFALE